MSDSLTLTSRLDFSSYLLTVMLLLLGLAFAVPVVALQRGDLLPTAVLLAVAMAWTVAVYRSRATIYADVLDIRMLLGRTRFPISRVSSIDVVPAASGLNLELQLEATTGQ